MNHEQKIKSKCIVECFAIQLLYFPKIGFDRINLHALIKLKSIHIDSIFD